MNFTVPPLSSPLCDATDKFANAPFDIGSVLPPTAQTCPQPGVFAPNGLLPNPANLPGGCTRDLVHRFYQEQYQLNDGEQNRYVTGSDAVGLAMGYYDTQQLPIYTYLHEKGHPDYAIADNFFQAAFGGSFLNHQWLIAAATPTWPGEPAGQHAIVDSNGMPNKYPLYTPTGPVADPAGTRACPVGARPESGARVRRLRGEHDPADATSRPARTRSSSRRRPATTIGDELTAAGVSWAWYSGGWSNADGDVGAPGWTNGTGTTCSDPDSFPNPAFPYCPNKVFQFHHQAFNYFANYAPGTPGRTHLQDEVVFQQLAHDSSRSCKLNSVSFIKPIGLENEHPGYTSVPRGSDHLVDLLQMIEGSKCAKDTLVIVTYDEFGGQWDHVSPPGQGNHRGPHDQWGPGTRIPALIVSPDLRSKFVVDHTQYDTTSILATIEARYHLAPLSSRDAAVNDLFDVFRAKGPHGEDDGGGSDD